MRENSTATIAISVNNEARWWLLRACVRIFFNGCKILAFLKKISTHDNPSDELTKVTQLHGMSTSSLLGKRPPSHATT